MIAPSFRFPAQRTGRAKVHARESAELRLTAARRASYCVRHEQPETHPQSRVPRRRARHALPPRDQGDPQGAAADRRPAADPVRGRRGARGGDRADDLRHRPRQDRARRAFRHRLRARDDDGASAARTCRCSSRRGFTPGNLITVRQQVPLGLGHAIWCARAIVGDEPFAILLPDELMVGTPGCMAQMVEAYDEVGGNLISVLEVPREEVSSYGVIDPGREQRRADRSARAGREAAGRRGAVEQDHLGPLHPPARSHAHAREARRRAPAARSS